MKKQKNKKLLNTGGDILEEIIVIQTESGKRVLSVFCVQIGKEYFEATIHFDDEEFSIQKLKNKKSFEDIAEQLEDEPLIVADFDDLEVDPDRTYH